MSQPEDSKYGRCQATAKSSGKQCGRAAIGEHGKCGYHGGKGGAPEDNGNAITHGAKADPMNLYNHLSEQEQGWVDSLIDGYCKLLNYDDSDPRRSMIKLACVNIYQANSGEGQILEDGLSESQTIGVSESGQPVVRNESHHLSDDVLARTREARQILRTAGAFEDPESQKANAIDNLATSITRKRVGTQEQDTES